MGSGDKLQGAFDGEIFKVSLHALTRLPHSYHKLWKELRRIFPTIKAEIKRRGPNGVQEVAAEVLFSLHILLCIAYFVVVQLEKGRQADRAVYIKKTKDDADKFYPFNPPLSTLKKYQRGWQHEDTFYFLVPAGYDISDNKFVAYLTVPISFALLSSAYCLQ